MTNNNNFNRKGRQTLQTQTTAQLSKQAAEEILSENTVNPQVTNSNSLEQNNLNDFLGLYVPYNTPDEELPSWLTFFEIIKWMYLQGLIYRDEVLKLLVFFEKLETIAKKRTFIARLLSYLDLKELEEAELKELIDLDEVSLVIEEIYNKLNDRQKEEFLSYLNPSEKITEQRNADFSVVSNNLSASDLLPLQDELSELARLQQEEENLLKQINENKQVITQLDLANQSKEEEINNLYNLQQTFTKYKGKGLNLARMDTNTQNNSEDLNEDLNEDIGQEEETIAYNQPLTKSQIQARLDRSTKDR